MQADYIEFLCPCLPPTAQNHLFVCVLNGKSIVVYTEDFLVHNNQEHYESILISANAVNHLSMYNTCVTATFAVVTSERSRSAGMSRQGCLDIPRYHDQPLEFSESTSFGSEGGLQMNGSCHTTRM